MVKCAGCGEETESRLKCPQCIALKKGDSYFCTQECFKSVYKEHCQKCHSTGEDALTRGFDSMASGFDENDITTWKKDDRLRPFVRYNWIFNGPLRPWPTTSMKLIPAGIPLPDYAKSGRSTLEERARGAPIHVHTDSEIARMKEACAIARGALDLAHSLCKVGVTPVEIDDKVHDYIIAQQAYPSPLNYYEFPKSCCISVNEVVCHGIPDLRPLREGDIVNVDITAYYRGMHADLNETYAVGEVDPESIRLMKCSHDAMMAAIAHCKPGAAYREIGKIIERHCKQEGFSVVRNYTGHGIGSLFHSNPNIPHYEANKAKGVMREGHVFTIEPMVNAGHYANDMWADNWTVCTTDGKRSAQFEHQILITKDGAEILTARLDSSPPLDF